MQTDGTPVPAGRRLAAAERVLSPAERMPEWAEMAAEEVGKMRV